MAQMINLIPTHRIDARRRKRRIRVWTVVVAVYASALVVGASAAHTVWGQADRRLADAAAEYDQKVREAQQQVVALEPALTEARVKLEASRAVAVQPDWSVLLALLAELRGERVVLQSVRLDPIKPADRQGRRVVRSGRFAGGIEPRTGEKKTDKADDESRRKPLEYRLDVNGLGRGQADVSAFVLRLEQTGLFDEVKLVETSRMPFGQAREPAVAFLVHCTLSESEGAERE